MPKASAMVAVSKLTSVCAAEWAGRQAVPRVEKYDIKPYEPEDDDEYRTESEKAKLRAELPAGGAASGGVSRHRHKPRLCMPPSHVSVCW